MILCADVSILKHPLFLTKIVCCVRVHTGKARTNSSTFPDKWCLQGLFKTALYFQVLFKPVWTLVWEVFGGGFFEVHYKLNIFDWVLSESCSPSPKISLFLCKISKSFLSGFQNSRIFKLKSIIITSIFFISEVKCLIPDGYVWNYL